VLAESPTTPLEVICGGDREVSPWSSGAPVRSMAWTSMWDASHGAISATRPVSTFYHAARNVEVASTRTA